MIRLFGYRMVPRGTLHIANARVHEAEGRAKLVQAQLDAALVEITDLRLKSGRDELAMNALRRALLAVKPPALKPPSWVRPRGPKGYFVSTKTSTKTDTLTG